MAEILESRALLATFTVTNVNDYGDGSLRQAMLDANELPGSDRIVFNIPGSGVHTIQPYYPLPEITDPVAIDGTSQPGFDGMPLIELDGEYVGDGYNAAAFSPLDGLRVLSGGTTIRSLIINRFPGRGISLIGAGGNIVAGNYLGTDSTGLVGQGNGQEGLAIQGSASNSVGGPSSADRNIISGNGYGDPQSETNVLSDGVVILATGSTGNVVQGNYVGLGIDGRTPIGNALSGVAIVGAGSNLIGGPSAGQGNLIGANGADGIAIQQNDGVDATGNTLAGNRIGTDASGQVDRGNVGAGVRLTDVSQNTIGVDGGAPNVLSGNSIGLVIEGGKATANYVRGNRIGTDVSGLIGVGNDAEGILIDGSSNNVIGGGGDEARNLISANGGDGVRVTGEGASDTISGNFIGLEVTGSRDLGNGRDGVRIEAGAGTNAIIENVLSGNTVAGLSVLNAAGQSIFGNLIGTDAAGARAVANDEWGIHLVDSAESWIGGPGSLRNLISGNGVTGLEISGASSTGNLVRNNLIGTDLEGTRAVPNGTLGIYLLGAGSNMIGGAMTDAGNILSGNGSVGLRIEGSTASNNVVQGNLIGTNADGSAGIPNLDNGVFVVNAPFTLIGGPQSEQRNVISGNGIVGVQVFGSGASSTLIQGNLIGVNVAGNSALANGFDGVFLNAAPNNVVLGNVLSGNGLTGLQILDTAATGNVVQGNLVGTDITGRFSIPNGVDGLFVNNAPSNVIRGNVISGNRSAGIQVFLGGSAGTTIQSNFIGTDITGRRAVPNRFGVFLNQTARIAIPRFGATRNVIRGNLVAGVIAQNRPTPNQTSGVPTPSVGGPRSRRA